jgi:hypothetical protein
MVYELKPPVEGSPGLLMFTHKEREFFVDSPAPVVERLRQLKSAYVLGMQWGRYHADVGETPLIDFHMACPGTVEFREDADVRRIPLCSRNFTPAYFRPMDVPVEWDVLSVGHPIEDKRYGELLDVIRMVFDAGVDLRVLLVCAVPDDPATLGPRWDHEFFEKYESLFSDAERERIDLGMPGEVAFGDRPIHPLPNEVFPHLYNASNAFTLFSREEGQSKVIHEALLCGTPVVVRENLRGGGQDYLDERNSLQFDSLASARDALVELAERPDEYAFDPSYLRSALAEDETADRLEAAIETVYEDLGHEYRGEMEKTDLAFKLGSHTVTLRPELREANTNDLRSRHALVVYIEELLSYGPGFEARLAARRADHAAQLAGFRSASVTGIAGTLLRRADRRTRAPVYRTAKRVHDRL